jgi:hypothetical protein
LDKAELKRFYRQLVTRLERKSEGEENAYLILLESIDPSTGRSGELSTASPAVLELDVREKVIGDLGRNLVGIVRDAVDETRSEIRRSA